MNDVSTHVPQSAESGQDAAGHGRHRGPVSTQDAETSPRGRHRRPAQENEHAESAA
ncbi:hypothetical protein [Streptomyces capillispiralis]|uniref:Uncharacterized protein n=1 Tax=Streptomyces capillispiralis TaxID=68182 RepID=A0A561TKU1_9ACTN|nr:hypothetical protein [Streptomyces capillispiralis]TWF87769.1 hypothetical protein FHX78_114786 [Streptomyces capillispiralis]GHH93909.1 hypothetical protein GCM10017779_43660 [Streptomyces capillispiralis]